MFTPRRSLGIIVILCGLLAGAVARAQDVEPPPDPETERASFTVAEGFEVTLFAAEPMVAKPIQINFDSKGRLWVASSSVYPQIKPGAKPEDQVVVLEDIDGDGRADKNTVFADGLLIPTGVLPGDGGAYVANSTEIVHYADPNDDLKADDYRVVLSGFGTEDTHHIIHTFRWGFDARFWFNQSIYIHSHVETPNGTRRLYGSGIWRYRPESEQLDVFAYGMVNPWGHTWDRWGANFSTDGAGGEGIYYTFPGSAFQSAVGFERILHGLNAGSPKYCGAELVSGRHLPDDWQQDIIVNDFRANRVVRHKLAESDNGYFTSKLMPDVITSTSRFFRPVDVKIGPDGAIYIADWCNEIINHGEVDFRDPRRDKVHGRIWRLSAKGRPLVSRPNIAGQPVAALLELLKAPEDWTRLHAKLEMRNRGATDVVPALAEWVKKLDTKDADYERLRLEALWVYQGLDVPEPQLLASLLTSKDHRARAAAVRVVPDWQRALPNAPDLIASRVIDDHARVRLEATRAVARIPSASSVEIAMRAAEKPVDPYIDYALWLTANELKDRWLPEFRAGRLKFGGRGDQMNRALQAVKSPDAITVLIGQLKEGKLSPQERGDVFDMITAVGTPEHASAVLDAATAADADAVTRARALTALERGIRQRDLAPVGGDVRTIEPLLDSPDTTVRAAAIAFAGAWKPAELRAKFANIASAPNTPPGVRRAAAAALADGEAESVLPLQQIADDSTQPVEVRAVAVGALVRLTPASAAKRAAELLTGDKPLADPSELINAFLQREGAAEVLSRVLLMRGNLSKDTAKLALRAINTTGRDAGGLTAVLRTAAGLDATAKEPTSEEVRGIVAKVQQQGDAARGEQVFRRADTGCFGCHAIAGAGAQVGPDLRAIGASSPADYIVESILAPSKAIKDGYQSAVVATKRGDVYSGIKVSQDDKQIVLRDVTNDAIVIPLDHVRRERAGGSLMPTGLADVLTEQEFLDLIAFLTALGKPGPYAAGPELVIRRWRVLDDPVPDATLLQSPGADALPWRAGYTLVSGELPLPAEAKGQIIVRGQIDVTSAGNIGIALNSPDGISLLIDGRPAEVDQRLTADLSAGLHTLTFVIDPAKRTSRTLRVEVSEGPNGGHAQPLGGR